MENLTQIKEKLATANQPFIIAESEDNGEEFVNFYFLGKYEGQEVVYDAVMYTLRLHHESELYEIAEHEAAKRFSSFKKIKYEEDENGDMEILDGEEEEIGLYMAEIIMELEEEGSVKVQEHVDLDPNIDDGVGLDIGLNLEKINNDSILKFINDFNDDNLNLDDTLYSFHIEKDL